MKQAWQILRLFSEKKLEQQIVKIMCCSLVEKNVLVVG